MTRIADYSALQGDAIDASAIATALPPLYSGELVRVSEDASGAFAVIEVNSAGHWTAVAQLRGRACRR